MVQSTSSSNGIPNDDATAISVERHTLANGLRVVLHHDARLPLVALNLWYHVGSKNERPGKTGFAHLFEHMLFQGSQNVGTNDHFSHIQQVGGVANGSTSRDRTNYYETLPSHHLDLGLWLESDRMGFLLPAMTEEKLENQRQVVMNERRQRVDNQPYGRALERLHELLFPGDHPYHWPVIGYMEDIEAASLDDVRSFFRTYYRPNNAVLTLAGDFDADRALAGVERYFGPIPAGSEPPPVTATTPAADGEVREVLEDDIQLPRIYLAYRVPRFGEADWYAADLLAGILAGGKSSRLHEELVYRRQIAQNVGAYAYDNEEAGILLFLVTVAPDTSIDTVEAALLAEIEAMANAVPEADFERARNQRASGQFAALQRLDHRADRLSQLTTYFDAPERLAEETRRYAEVGREAISAMVARFCTAANRAVVTVVARGEAG